MRRLTLRVPRVNTETIRRLQALGFAVTVILAYRK
jgi:hypothetical protein